MVENLNKLTFSGYGRVLRDSLPNRGFPSGAQWQESVQYFSAEGLCFYRQSAGPVYLDFELGMTVLAVRREGETAYFYLDKPVCLPAGREFAILPYQTECSVRLAQPAGAQLEVLEPVTAAENLKLGDRLRVGEIYTLFYREVESGFLFKGEQHSMFELTYVDRGSLHCVVDGNGVELHQGQLMVFGPQQWHMQYTDLDMTARFLTVSFDLESEFAARLPDERMTFLTSGPNIAMELLKKSKPIVNLVGGMINRDNLSVAGPQALEYLANVNVDLAFLTPSGFSPENGFTSGNYAECEFKRLVLEKARHTIVLMDHTKMDKCLPYTIGRLEDVQVFITDKDPGEDLRRRALEAGVEMVAAGPSDSQNPGRA